MRVGYGRVSTDKETQKFDRQEDQLKDAGCEAIYLERISGRKSRDERPELNRMINDLINSEDEVKQVVCVSLDRICRSTKNMLELVELFKNNDIDLISIKEGSLIGDSPQSTFFVTILSAFAQMEADACSMRVRDGLKAAKRRGKTLGRPCIDPDKMDTAIRMYLSRDYSVAEVCRIAQISKQTLYNELKRRGVSRE